MPYAITLCIEGPGATLTSRLWAALADAGFSSDSRDLGYPPHITLAIFDGGASDGPEPDGARAALAVLARRRPVPVNLTGLAVFTPACLWAAPAANPALIALHTALLDQVRQPCHPHYAPGAWTPHVTLASDLATGQLGPALQLAAAHWQPGPALGTRLELVRFRPVAVLDRWALGA